MTQNTTPIFPLVPNIGMGLINAANTAMDGTGTVVTIFTAGANGSFVSTCLCKSAGTTAQSVLRLFVNNGSTNTTNTNNSLIMDYSLEQTNNNSSQTQNFGFEIPLNINLPAGWTILATLGTATGSANWALTVFGGNY